MAVPLVLVPVFFVVAPWRLEAWFVSGWALFAGERWNFIRIGDAAAGDMLLVLAAGAGAALFLRDALPPIFDSLRRVPDGEIGPWAMLPPHVHAAVDRQAAVHGVAPPALRVVQSRRPVLLCQGGRVPEVTLSPATLRLLDADELEAALAHELVHVRHGDPAWGYALIAARAIGFFNPAIQWAARAVVDEMERRADQEVVARGGDARALASDIGKLFEGGRPSSPGPRGAFARAGWRAHAIGIRRRQARLDTEPVPHAATTSGWLRVGLAAGGLAGLLFFVV